MSAIWLKASGLKEWRDVASLAKRTSLPRDVILGLAVGSGPKRRRKPLFGSDGVSKAGNTDLSGTSRRIREFV
jgi:hypothetical protein